MDTNQLSRRHFLKKTAVLSVGVASMTLFAGLVNASNSSDSYGNIWGCEAQSTCGGGGPGIPKTCTGIETKNGKEIGPCAASCWNGVVICGVQQPT